MASEFLRAMGTHRPTTQSEIIHSSNGFLFAITLCLAEVLTWGILYINVPLSPGDGGSSL